jgi:hypothetical protein
MSIGFLMKDQRSGAMPGRGVTNGTAKLHDLGQSIWLDNITRDLRAERCNTTSTNFR